MQALNGMNYLTTALIKSSKTLNELEEYYVNYDVEVQEQTTIEFINKYLEHKSIEYDNMKNYDPKNDNYYVIYIYASNYEDSFYDYRGH